MDDKVEALKEEIEKARKILNEKIEQTGNVMDAYEESIRLDHLIEEYEKIKK